MAEPIRVLHIDDQPDFTAMAAEFLERADERLEIVTAASASEGMDRLRSDSIDCIVSDYDMPETDGIALLEEVRAEFGELPFILYTGKGTEEVASEAISTGVTDYLQKKTGTEQYAVLRHRIVNAVDRYRTHHALEVNKQRFRTLVEESTDAIFIVGPDGTFEFVTPAVERVLGYKADDLIGRNGFDNIHPDDRERVQERFMALVADTDDAAEVEYRYRHADDHWVWIEARGRNLLQDDVIEGIVVYARDVTDRHQREEQMERQERILETLGDAVYALDAEGRITELNDRAEELLGYSREELVGEPVSVVLSDEDVEKGTSTINELLAAGGDGVGTFEEVIRTADGDTIECAVHVTVLQDDDGTFLGSAGVVRNISDRKQQEEKLNRLRQRSQLLMNTETREETARVATEAADDIIGAPLSGVHFVTDDGTRLEAVSLVEDVHEVFDETPGYDRAAEEGSRAALVWGVFDRGAPLHIDDTTAYPSLEEATPTRSVIIHPIGDHGVFIVSSPEPNAFDETDEALVEILSSSLTSAMDRVDREQRLRERERRLERLHDATLELMGAETQQEIAERAVAAGEDILGFPIVLVRLYDEERGGLVPVAQNDSLEDVLPERPVFTAEGTSLNWEAYEAGEVRLYENVGEIDRAFDADTALENLMVLPLGEYGTIAAGETSPAAFGENDLYLARILASETEAALQRADRETELRHQQTALERQNERLNEFAGIVSHDLRNPLAVAKGRIGLAMEESDSEHLPPIATALDRMDQIIDRTLTLARQGQVVGETEPVALADLVKGCWLNIEADAATLTLADPPTVLADPERLPHLFENLFRNAVEHGGQSVGIEVGGLPDGFYVEDDGPGIPEADRSLAFKVGYSTSETGTGLGLGIVREIAEAHGWRLSVAEGSAGGARFEFIGVDLVAEQSLG